MNLRILLPALFCSLCLVAGAQDKTTVTKSPSPNAPTSVKSPRVAKTKSPRFGGIAKTDTLFFSMERTPCFGTCKAYRINVYRSGYATFEGRAHVEKEGMHSGHVGKDTLEMLMKEAEKIRFFELKDKYDSEVTDLPSSVIRIIGMGKDKRVIGRVGTPATFTSFFNKAEALLYPVAWKPLAPKE